MSFHLQYGLTRAQRLIPLLRIQGFLFTPFAVAMFAFFCFAAVHSIFYRSLQGIALFGALAALVFYLFPHLFLGVFDVITKRIHYTEFAVTGDVARVSIRGKPYYVFLDSLTKMKKYRPDLWTLHHPSDTVFHIPAALLDDAQRAHIEAAIARGRTPEGIQAIMRRGRMIQAVIDGELPPKPSTGQGADPPTP